MEHNLARNVKFTRISTAVAATSSALNMSVIDMQGFDGVTFVAAFTGTPSSAGIYFKAQSGTSSGGGDMVDLSSSASFVSTGIDAGFAIVEVYRPPYRYARMVGIAATTGLAVDAAFAEQYRGFELPVTHSTAGLYNAVYLNHPSSGGAT